MTGYTAANGTPFTDEDIERWAAEDESEKGYTGSHLGPSHPGPPVSAGEKARPDCTGKTHEMPPVPTRGLPW